MKRRRTPVVLVACLVVVTGGAVFAARAMDRHWKRERCAGAGLGPEDCVALNDMRAKYGFSVYSQAYEEMLVRDFFEERRGGFFLDVGAGHWREHSTTLFLEERRGWRGIAVDANPAFAGDYAKHRPGTKFFSFFATDKAEAARPFYVATKWGLSSGDKGYITSLGDEYREIAVPSMTLDAMLEREGVKHVDLLSMDIEQGEPAALAGFDIERFGVELVCIEMQEPVADAIRAYMAKHGYVRVERYARFDGLNDYYAPRTSPRLRALR